MLRFHQIWPISGRDFVELNNWRLLEDGSVLVVQFSTTSELKPELKDPIRGETIATGFLLTPKPTGTHVVLTIFSDPKGSLPSALVNQGAIAQASGLLESKKLLEKKTGLKEVGAAATYEGKPCSFPVVFTSFYYIYYVHCCCRFGGCNFEEPINFKTNEINVQSRCR